MSLNRKNSSEALAGIQLSQLTLPYMILDTSLKDSTTIVEERNSKGDIVKRYSKGRFLGKVISLPRIALL